jgi:hypothetical protein
MDYLFTDHTAPTVDGFVSPTESPKRNNTTNISKEVVGEDALHYPIHLASQRASTVFKQPFQRIPKESVRDILRVVREADEEATLKRRGDGNATEGNTDNTTAPATSTIYTSTMERLSTRPASAVTNRSTNNTAANASKHQRPMSATTSHKGGPSPTNTPSGFDVGAFRTFNATDKRRTLVGMMRSDQAALAQERQDGAKAAFALRSALSRPASAASVLQTSSVHSSSTNVSRGGHSYLSASGGRKTVSNYNNNTIPIHDGSSGVGNNSSSLVLGRGATLTSSDEVDAGVYRTKLFGRNEKAYL